MRCGAACQTTAVPSLLLTITSKRAANLGPFAAACSHATDGTRHFRPPEGGSWRRRHRAVVIKSVRRVRRRVGDSANCSHGHNRPARDLGVRSDWFLSGPQRGLLSRLMRSPSNVRQRSNTSPLGSRTATDTSPRCRRNLNGPRSTRIATSLSGRLYPTNSTSPAVSKAFAAQCQSHCISTPSSRFRKEG